jgi:hypothetical protein
MAAHHDLMHRVSERLKQRDRLGRYTLQDVEKHNDKDDGALTALARRAALGRKSVLTPMLLLICLYMDSGLVWCLEGC